MSNVPNDEIADHTAAIEEKAVAIERETEAPISERAKQIEGHAHAINELTNLDPADVAVRRAQNRARSRASQLQSIAVIMACLGGIVTLFVLLTVINSKSDQSRENGQLIEKLTTDLAAAQANLGSDTDLLAETLVKTNADLAQKLKDSDAVLAAALDEDNALLASKLVETNDALAAALKESDAKLAAQLAASDAVRADLLSCTTLFDEVGDTAFREYMTSIGDLVANFVSLPPEERAAANAGVVLKQTAFLATYRVIAENRKAWNIAGNPLPCPIQPAVDE